MDLPIELPPVHIDLLWLKAKGASSRHLWLKETLMRASSEMLAMKRSN
jgi:hypothetical protein